MFEENGIEEILLKLTSAALKGEKYLIPEFDEAGFPMDELLAEAKNQTVLPLVVSASNLSSKIGSHYSRENRNQIGLNMRVIGEHCELHKMMTEAGIPYVIMKGASVAMLYPDPTLRTMGDVDFLVAKSDFERADRVFKEHGFIEKVDKENFCHVSYRRKEKNGVTYEMHWEPNGIPGGSIGSKIRSEIPDIIASAETVGAVNGEMCVPGVYYRGLILLLHTATHMINSGIGLRQLCDWAVFCERLTDSELYGIFKVRLEEIGLWTFACTLTQLTAIYLGCRKREFCEKETRSMPFDEIMSDILDGGNLGMKDPQRLNQAKLLTNHEKGTVNDDSAVKQLFMTLNEKARSAMPVCEKCSLLLPVGWVVVIVRHFFRIIFGRRSVVRPLQNLHGANKRKKLYSKLKLFEG